VVRPVPRTGGEGDRRLSRSALHRDHARRRSHSTQSRRVTEVLRGKFDGRREAARALIGLLRRPTRRTAVFSARLRVSVSLWLNRYLRDLRYLGATPYDPL